MFDDVERFDTFFANEIHPYQVCLSNSVRKVAHIVDFKYQTKARFQLVWVLLNWVNPNPESFWSGTGAACCAQKNASSSP